MMVVMMHPVEIGVAIVTLRAVPSGDGVAEQKAVRGMIAEAEVARGHNQERQH